VLAWVFRRCDDEAEAVETPIGRLPTEDSLPTEGLDVPPDDLRELLSMDADAWRAQLPQVRDHLASFGDRLPEALRKQLAALEAQVT
jgi:phosphoenolpyruvate carboxykinase (GTP)